MTSESQNIEWKQNWHDDYLKWICGFANAQGGRIFVGKDDSGKTVGLKNAKKLPEELTIEQLLQTHESFPRNPLIADVCYKAGYIDSWGRGVEKITEACEQAGLPKPIFIERSGGMLVTLTRTTEILNDTAKTVSEKRVYDFGTISERIRKEFGTSQANTFEIICQHPEFTAEQIAEKTGKTTRTVENHIAKLKKAGIIVRKGPKLGGYWEIIALGENK